MGDDLPTLRGISPIEMTRWRVDNRRQMEVQQDMPTIDAHIGPQVVSTDKAPPPASDYAQAVVFGGFAFISGQTPRRGDGTIPTDFEEQVREVLEHLKGIAAACHSSLRNAVKFTVYLNDLGQRGIVNRVLLDYTGDQRVARTSIQAPFKDFDVEIDAILAIPTA